MRCMASYFITDKRVYDTPDNDSIVLEKCNFVLDKSLKSPEISFKKKCGNLLYEISHDLEHQTSISLHLLLKSAM